MTDIALIDIDGVVLNSKPRAEDAQGWVEHLLGDAQHFLSEETYLKAYNEIFYTQDAFYRPEWMREDHPLPGTKEYLALLEEKEWHLFFYTSRMENQRAVTEDTLWSHELFTPQRDLLMKPMEFQRTPNLNYKVGLIPMIARLLKASRVLFIDDEEKIREAVLKANIGHPEDIEIYASLAEACA